VNVTKTAQNHYKLEFGLKVARERRIAPTFHRTVFDFFFLSSSSESAREYTGTTVQRSPPILMIITRLLVVLFFARAFSVKRGRELKRERFRKRVFFISITFSCVQFRQKKEWKSLLYDVVLMKVLYLAGEKCKRLSR
jgi:hypothetical protein